MARVLRTLEATLERAKALPGLLADRWKALPAMARYGTLIAAAAVGTAAALAVVWSGLPSSSPETVSAAVPSLPPDLDPQTPDAAPSSPSAPTAPDSSVSPLTGLPGPAGRILAVKIDNIVNARPQTGINYADVVYAIEVEGGLSRFLAVFDSEHMPPGDRIGPVRSARESDLPLLQQYGKVDFVYSGALTKFLPLLARADVFNASPTQDDSSFFRGTWNVAPYNQYVVPSSVLRHFPDAAQARDIGFRFGPDPGGGTPVTSVTARMPAASFTFTWSPEQQKFMIAMDGRAARTTDAGQMSAPTVVIQKVDEATSPNGFMDSPHVLSPYSPTVGSGDAVVLRDGKQYPCTWSRTDPAGGTTFSYNGQPMAFHPGQVWVVLEAGQAR